MNKTKRVAAMIGIIFIVSLYVFTFISAIFTTPYTKGLFTASIFSSFVIPVMIYAYMLVYKWVRKKDNSDIKEMPKLQDDSDPSKKSK